MRRVFPTCATVLLAALACGEPSSTSDAGGGSGAPGDSIPEPAPEPAAVPNVEDFTWPDPLPAAAPEVPAMQKGLVIGTWSFEALSDFTEPVVDEANLREVYTGHRVARRTWRGFTSMIPVLPLDTLVPPDRPDGKIGYAFSLMSRAEANAFPDAPAVLHLRHRGRVRAFYDGRLVVDEPPPALGGWHEVRVPVVMTGPYDVVLIKVGRGIPELGESAEVEVRVSAPDGSAIPHQGWNSMRPPSLPSDLPPPPQTDGDV